MSSGSAGALLYDLNPADGNTTPVPGVSTGAARGDHKHRTVSPTAPVGAARVLTLGAAPLAARQDHQHAGTRAPFRTVGLWHPYRDLDMGASVLGLSVGELYYVPFVSNGETLDAIAVVSAFASAGALLRLGLAFPAANGLPGARAAQWGTVLGTTTGTKALTGLATVVPAGEYWLALLVEVNTWQIAASSGPFIADASVGDSAGTPTATAKLTAYKATGVAAGNIPANAPALAAAAMLPTLMIRTV